MPNYTPLVNGTAYSYADITVNILGVPLAGITSIEYEETAEIENNYGAGRRPVSRSHGKIEATASMTIERGEYNSLLQAAKAVSNTGLIGLPEFDVIVSYLPEGSPASTDIIKNCRFKTNKGGGSEGDSNITVDLELVPSHVEWDALA